MVDVLLDGAGAVTGVEPLDADGLAEFEHALLERAHLSFVASVSIGNLVAGVVTNAWGPQTAIVAGGICATAFGVVSLAVMKAVRELD